MSRKEFNKLMVTEFKDYEGIGMENGVNLFFKSPISKEDNDNFFKLRENRTSFYEVSTKAKELTELTEVSLSSKNMVCLLLDTDQEIIKVSLKKDEFDRIYDALKRKDEK